MVHHSITRYFCKSLEIFLWNYSDSFYGCIDGYCYIILVNRYLYSTCWQDRTGIINTELLKMGGVVTPVNTCGNRTFWLDSEWGMGVALGDAWKNTNTADSRRGKRNEEKVTFLSFRALNMNFTWWIWSYTSNWPRQSAVMSVHSLKRAYKVYFTHALWKSAVLFDSDTEIGKLKHGIEVDQAK